MPAAPWSAGANFDPGELRKYLLQRKESYSGDNASLPVIIDFDSKVRWADIVEVLEICKDLEITDIGFATPDARAR